VNFIQVSAGAKASNINFARVLYISFFALGLLFSVIVFARSPGPVFDDETGHIVIAQQVWRDPDLALNIWGRVANTLAYSVPSLFGVNGARVGSLLMTCLTVLLTTKVAIKLGVKHFYFIPLFFWFQPWVMELSYQGITQIPFSLYAIAGIYFWLDGKNNVASLLFGLLPLTRHEGIVMTGLWFLLMLQQRHWRAASLAWLPMVIYNVVYLLALQPPLLETPFALYFNSGSTTIYGIGGWFHFFPYLIWGMGIPVFFWTLLSLPSILRMRDKALLVVFYAAYFLIHSIIYRFGLFASGGYGMFVFPLAPAAALLGTLGAEYILQGINRASRRNSHVVQQRAQQIMLSLIIVPIIINSLLMWTPTPQLKPEHLGLSAAANWIREQRPQYEQIYSTHPWFYNALPLELPGLSLWAKTPPLETLSAGTIIVWDQHFSNDFGAPLAVLQTSDDWAQIASFENEAVIIFEKQ